MGLLTSNPDRIDFSESQCSSVDSISLYQHLGQGLGGGDYFVINSQFTSDNPSGAVTHDPSAGFATSAQMKITPMVFDGTHYVGKPAATVPSPFEGDSVLSPSTKLVVSRFGNEGNQLGYVLRKITATPSGSSVLDLDPGDRPLLRAGCEAGHLVRRALHGRPPLRRTERLRRPRLRVGERPRRSRRCSRRARSNILVVDLVTGARTRVTTMKAGQYALFPHFRSDGWFYFLVRDKNTNKEYVMASDAALQL